jgi:hypothetical protein
MLPIGSWHDLTSVLGQKDTSRLLFWVRRYNGHWDGLAGGRHAEATDKVEVHRLALPKHHRDGRVDLSRRAWRVMKVAVGEVLEATNIHLEVERE